MIMKNLLHYLSFRASEARTRYGISIILIAILVSISSCDSDDDNDCQGIDCLPPITQTGAGTFGCLVNGKPFVDNSGNFNCFYQLVDGEFFFGIGSNLDMAGLTQIIIGSDASSIQTASDIPLNENTSGEFYAEISIPQVSGDFTTNSTADGIIRFNEFTIQIPETGEIYNITDGRFDAIFTQ
jgi:hypothetical protein